MAASSAGNADGARGDPGGGGGVYAQSGSPAGIWAEGVGGFWATTTDTARAADVIDMNTHRAQLMLCSCANIARVRLDEWSAECRDRVAHAQMI
jgi:hypothetical protein